MLRKTIWEDRPKISLSFDIYELFAARVQTNLLLQGLVFMTRFQDNWLV